ncbi:ABC transporter permease [Stackebrandtia soli]|uniref:ABC transporter permease n=1 Tax=Stackebrandtia soli TaxID=1892856 RepID=UPI0039EA315A
MTTIAVSEAAESKALHGFWTRSRKTGLTLAVLGLVVVLVGLFGISSTDSIHLSFNVTLEATLPAINARLIIVLLGVIGLAAGVVLVQSRVARFGVYTGTGVGALALGALFMATAPTGAVMPLESMLSGSMFLALPLIFGSLSGVLCERSGIINVGIEGQFLAGAFSGALVATMTGNLWIGVLSACIAGALVTYILAALAIKYRVDQVVLGVILNLLVAGLTGYLYDTLMAPDQSAYNNPGKAPTWNIPLLGDIPLIGPVLFRQNIFTYLALALVAGIYVMLFHSRWGLRTRAVGEHPAAADTVGIKVNALRMQNVLIAGLVSGLGGAFFTIGTGLDFSKDMTAGKGFIALAVLIVGRWSPLGAFFGALLFGFADRTQTFLAAVGSPVPTQLLSMLPYLVTIVAVAGLIGRVRAPAADGKPYIKE